MLKIDTNASIITPHSRYDALSLMTDFRYPLHNVLPYVLSVISRSRANGSPPFFASQAIDLPIIPWTLG